MEGALEGKGERRWWDGRRLVLGMEAVGFDGAAGGGEKRRRERGCSLIGRECAQAVHANGGGEGGLVCVWGWGQREWKEGLEGGA